VHTGAAARAWFVAAPAAWLALVALQACRPTSPEARGQTRVMTAQLAADLTSVRQARILFSHHSVGENILAGMARLDAEAGGALLRIRRLDVDAPPDGPVLLHASGGRNNDPRSKIDFFAGLLRGPHPPRLDLAFMKLCYVDFNPSTDVRELFSYYRKTLEALKREHPEVRFAHATVPLFLRPTDFKSSVRRWAGLVVWEDAANVKRNEFNRLLLEAFPADPVFDLARIESEGPDGHASTFQFGGRTYPSLHPGLTQDGGHLNALGQELAGAAAIGFLARAIQQRPVAH
jgi:hypothetical protein